MSFSVRISIVSTVLCITVFALGLVGSAAAQTESPNRDVLSLRLQTLFPEEGEAKVQGPGQYPGEVDPLHVQRGGERAAKAAPSGEPQYGVFLRTPDPDALEQAGIPYNSVLADVVTARLTRDEIAAASYVPGVERIRAARAAKPHNDVAAGLSGVRALNNGRLNDTKYTGAGTLVCVIDSGIDYTHRDFRGITDDTQSRILFLWDQTLTTQSDEDTPEDRGDSDFNGFNYGAEYTRTDIEDEIDGSPAGEVRQTDTDGHGTHVAGTAAGNGGGHPERKYKGMAPEADIIFVKAGDDSFPFSNVVDGMNYCGEVAEDEGKPVVVNMSLGADFGPHDGTSTEDEAVDSFVNASSGRAVVISAGNEGDSGMHTTSSIASGGGTTSFDISVPSAASGDFEADVWMSSADDVTVSIETPGGTTVTVTPADGSKTVATGEGEVFLSNETDPNVGGGDRSMVVLVDNDAGPDVAAGTWTVTLENTSGNTVTHHTWLFDDQLDGGVTADLVGGDSNYTIGTPGSSKEAITIGSYVHRWRWCDDDGDCFGYDLSSPSADRSDDISAFSSIGPLRDETQKPNVAGPGQGMGSALSDDMSASNSRTLPGGKHRLTQGTSMSAPATAGSVALLFQEDPNLTASTIKSTLESTAQTDGFTGGVPNDTWGHGKLDALRAMIHTINGSPNKSREVLTYDDWGGSTSSSISGSERFAVRFTPTFDGQITGFLLHPSSTVSLSQPLSVEIWSDDGGGLPDQKLGSTVSWDQALIFAFTWNYLDLTDTNVHVESGTDYHVVITLGDSGDSMFVRHDGSSSGRSSFFDGSSWGSFGSGDLRMRPVVTTLNRRRVVVGTDNTGNDTGWRLLAPPSDATRGSLEGDLDFNVDSGNLLHTWAGGGPNAWSAATSSSDPLPRGEGFLLYFFDDSTDPLTSGGVPLDVPNGSEDQSTNVTVGGLNTSHEFHLLGNPYTEAFDLGDLDDLASAGFQSVVQIWDPDQSSFTTITQGDADDNVAAWQGFFVERTTTGAGASSLTFQSTGKMGRGPTGDLIGSKTEPAETGRVVVDLRLSVTNGASTVTQDAASVLFDGSATPRWDAFEATQLTPPKTEMYATLSSPLLQGETLVHRTQASFPFPEEAAPVTMPLSVRSVKANGTATIGWPDEARARVPEGWTVELEDTKMDARVDLSATSYSFDVADGDGTLSNPDEARFRLHVGGSAPLPVELANFQAQADHGAVRLTWATASETNNTGFYVQRRVGAEEHESGGAWERVGFVEGAGTTQEAQTYHFADEDVPFRAEVFTYRLRQVDTDGTAHLSETVTVQRSAVTQTMLKAPFPNPAPQHATLQYAVPTSMDVQIAVYDVLGRRVATWAEGRVDAGRYEQQVATGRLAPGTYFVRLNAKNRVLTRRLTVVR